MQTQLERLQALLLDQAEQLELLHSTTAKMVQTDHGESERQQQHADWKQSSKVSQGHTETEILEDSAISTVVNTGDRWRGCVDTTTHPNSTLDNEGALDSHMHRKPRAAAASKLSPVKLDSLEQKVSDLVTRGSDRRTKLALKLQRGLITRAEYTQLMSVDQRMGSLDTRIACLHLLRAGV